MKMGRFVHATADAGTPVHVGHGSYDLFATLLFGGRRKHVFTELTALAGVCPGDRVLDVGCGTGYFTRLVAEAAGRDGTATGVDPSPEAVARARRVTRPANCSFAEGTAEALDALDDSYDVVVSSLMIHHLPEAMRPQAVAEMFRVLRPGGRVLIAEFRPPASRIGRVLIRHTAGPVMENNPIHLLEPMVGEAGFEHVRSGDLRPWIRYVQALKPSGP